MRLEQDQNLQKCNLKISSKSYIKVQELKIVRVKKLIWITNKEKILTRIDHQDN